MSTAHVIQFLIQSAGLSLFAAVVASCPRRPERRASAALIGLLVCGLLPFLSSAPPVRETVTRHQVVRVEIPQMVETQVPVVSEAPVETTMPVTPQASAPVVRGPIDFRWMIWLLPTGVLLGILRIARDVWITRRWAASLTAPDDTQWQRIESASPETMARSVFRVSNVGPGPCLIGFWRPRIVLPVWLLEPGKNRELEWAIRHECEHFRAHDSRWIVAVRLMTALHWWNPFMHLLARSWDQSRERVCDLKAAGDAGERCGYGHFILSLATADQPRMVAAMAVSGNAKRLRKRIDSLLGAKRGVSRIGTLWRVAMIGLMCGAGWFFSGFGFALEKAPEPAGGAEDDLSWLEPKPVLEIKVTALLSAEPLARNGEVLTNESSKSLIARCARMKNSHVQILGSGTVDPTGPLTIQLTANRENSLSEPPWDGTRKVGDFVGWVFRAEMDGAELKSQATYAFPPGVHPSPSLHIPTSVPRFPETSALPDPPPVLPTGTGWHQVKLKEGSLKSRIRSGESVCLSLGEVERGVNALCVVQLFERMPWQSSRVGEIVASNLKIVTGVEKRELFPEQTEEQKRTREELRSARADLENKLDRLPENRKLLELRKGSENELRIVTDDHEERRRLMWRIKAIGDRMWENCPNDLKVEILGIRSRQSKLNHELMTDDLAIKRAMWPVQWRRLAQTRNQEMREIREAEMKLDPTKFNHQEQ